jgi:hypothetical protein
MPQRTPIDVDLQDLVDLGRRNLGKGLDRRDAALLTMTSKLPSSYLAMIDGGVTHHRDC